MNWWCQPNLTLTSEGQLTTFGNRELEDLYGPQGWCMAEQPKIQCECHVDGACMGLRAALLPALPLHCRCLVLA